MTRPRRSWWRTPLIILGWVLALAVTYAVFADRNGNFPTSFYLVIGVLAFNYAINTLMEKLDSILWKLEDIEQRLPPKAEYDSDLDEVDYAKPSSAFEPPPEPPNSVESYQQQFRRPKIDTSDIDSYQKQFWKK
jgi:hypothetical protein